MIHEFDLLSTQLTWFVAVNWLATIACAIVLLLVYIRWRYLFLKPSLIALTLCHVLFQWPTAIFSGYYETWLPRPYVGVLFVHGFMILGLAGTGFLWNSATKFLWVRLFASPDRRTSSERQEAMVLSLFLCLLLAAIYLHYVPFSCTGLHALFVDPANAPLAREMSLKLLADWEPRYALTMLSAAVVPLLTGVIVAELPSRKALLNIGYVALLLVTWLLADLSGAKGIFVSLSLVIVSVVIWRQHLVVSIWTLPVMLAVALLPAVVIFLLIGYSPVRKDDSNIKACFDRIRLETAQPRETLITAFTRDPNPYPSQPTLKIPNSDLKSIFHVPEWLVAVGPVATYYLNIVSSQARAILYRSVFGPFEVGGWYLHYAQTRGPIGFAAIPRIARISGLEPIDAPNLIGRTYGPEYYRHDVAPTISAGASFIFTYAAYFGYWAIVLNLVLLWSLDIALWFYARVRDALLLPLVATVSVATLKFMEADYTVVWLTHGFGVVLVLGLGISFLLQMRQRIAGRASS